MNPSGLIIERGSRAVLAKSSRSTMSSKIPQVRARIAPKAPGVAAPTTRSLNRGDRIARHRGPKPQKAKHQKAPNQVMLGQCFR